MDAVPIIDIAPLFQPGADINPITKFVEDRFPKKLTLLRNLIARAGEE